MLDNHPCSFTFGDDLQLIAYDDVRRDTASEENLHTFTFYFVSGAQPRDAYDVRIEFLPRSTQIESFAQTVRLHPDAIAGMLSQVDLPVELPGKRSIKSYFPLVSVHDPATGQPIPTTQVISGVAGNQPVLTSCA